MGVGEDGGGSGQRLMQRHALFAMHHHRIINPTITQPPRTPSNHRRHSRNSLQTILINKRKFALFHRIATEADTERIEHCVALCVGERLIFGRERHDVCVVDWHGGGSRRFGFLCGGTVRN